MKLKDIVTIVEKNQVVSGRITTIIYNKIDRLDVKTDNEITDESTQINVNLFNEDGKTFGHIILSRKEDEIFQNPAQARKFMRDLFQD